LETTCPDFPGFECDLTGTLSEGIAALLRRPFRSRFAFLGRVEGFANLVQQYDLAVHPSRAESFGMAPIESLIAGTPTLVSVTGVVGELSLPPEWTFPPADIAALTQKLAALWRDWPPLPMVQVQARIRRGFHIDHTASKVRAQLEMVCPSHSTAAAAT
jgi:glycosyltransferase involved in cell wall biosynthesis